MTREDYLKEVCKVLDLHKEHATFELKAALAWFLLMPVEFRLIYSSIKTAKVSSIFVFG